jgi:Phosphotransferase enzyme family
VPQSKASIEPSSALRIERLLGKRIRAARKVTTGFSATQRWLIRTDSATRYFAKLGITPPSIDALRHEAWVYERLRLPCMPAVVAWQDHVTTPILILEDLSSLEWPPPWSDRTIAMALETIERIHSSSGPLLSYEERNGTEWDWWRAIEREPEPFLRLDMASGRWLRSSLPVLIECAGSVSPTGNAVAHFDLRSDNFCFSQNEARLVDWSLSCLGNPKLDLGLFLPGLAADRGPTPEELLPNEPGIAAWVAGFFAWHASKPFIPSAPGVREMQKQLLQSALPWAINELDLLAVT